MMTPPDVPSLLPAVRHLEDQHRFVMTVDGQDCVCDYRLDGSRVVFNHTGVPGSLQGRGIAAELVRTALDWARDRRLAVVPACSYVAVYLARHPEAA